MLIVDKYEHDNPQKPWMQLQLTEPMLTTPLLMKLLYLADSIEARDLAPKL